MKKQYCQQAPQAGFTLVELLVGLFLSLIISGIAITYLVSSSTSFRINANDGFIQENSRFAFTYLSNALRRAGSNSENVLATNLQLVDLRPSCQSVTGTGGNTPCTISNVGPNSSDKIAISYILRNGTSCNGQDISSFYQPSLQTVDELWIQTDANGVNNLVCRTSLRQSDGTLTPQGNTVPVIGGIDMLKFSYGVDTDGDLITDRYLTAEQITDPSSVRSIKAGLLVNSGLIVADDINTEQAQNRTYTVFGTPSATLNDQILRQVFSTTIHLPNAREGT